MNISRGLVLILKKSLSYLMAFIPVLKQEILFQVHSIFNPILATTYSAILKTLHPEEMVVDGLIPAA
jgi:hypothetical protein